MNRRTFIGSSLGSAGALLVPNTASPIDAAISLPTGSAAPLPTGQNRSRLPDLQPAHWIWYPSERCLPNTFVLFRRELTLAGKPRRATGWIAADSRYLLAVNSRRVQWGPAPADPRWPEADPLDLTDILQAGSNVLGATVLFYGSGDGTWAMGKPGFLFWLEIEHADGRKEMIVSDATWQAHLARAWPPGHYKRWFLRALQEEFDARLYPYGWANPGFTANTDWLPAMALKGSPNKPALAAGYYEYQTDVGSGPEDSGLRPRSIPLLRESLVPVKQLTETCWIEWLRPAEEYFECRPPQAFRVIRDSVAKETVAGQWTINLDGSRAAALTFEFAEQIVGWPYFTIEAPAGTTIELMVQEGHEVGGPALLNTHFDAWSRFICRQGENRFETFDFESCRWLQLHIRGPAGLVKVREVGLRRRQFPWPNTSRLDCSEPALQRLFDASINTLHNCAQETLVDGMGRERQQYSGDGGHQLHAVHYAFGETRLPARFVTTFSQGMTKDGFFLDCWPAYDRLARLMERQLDLTNWGPILDHGVGFNFDCWYHYLYSGELEDLREPYPRLLRFAQYLQSIIGKDGLLPVENLGIPSVWIDHQAYQRQSHKQCAFNLYAAAMLEHALAPICRAFGDTDRARSAQKFGQELRAGAVKKFWDPQRGLFVNNRPWLAQEKSVRCCDRSLATAVLFDQCPGGKAGPALKMLAECPPEMGFSYPCNAGWRLWALGKGGRADVIVKDLRERWATMASVKLNNSLQEDWQAHSDSHSQWSHCAVVPLYVAYMSLAGIKPLAPGFKRAEIRPQLADLVALELTAHTAAGPIHFQARMGRLILEIPENCQAVLVVPREMKLPLKPATALATAGHLGYPLPAGKTTTVPFTPK